MTQHDKVIANQSRPNFRQDLNNWLESVVTHNAGSDEPTATYPGMFWLDTSNAPDTIKQRNEADDGWIVLGYLETDMGLVARSGGVMDVEPTITTIEIGALNLETDRLITPLAIAPWKEDREPLITATLLNGWQHNSRTNGVYYRKTPARGSRIELYGSAYKLSASTTGEVIMNLPAGYRPLSDFTSFGIALGDYGVGRISGAMSIATNGNVTVFPGFSASGGDIQFYIEFEAI